MADVSGLYPRSTSRLRSPGEFCKCWMVVVVSRGCGMLLRLFADEIFDGSLILSQSGSLVAAAAAPEISDLVEF